MVFVFGSNLAGRHGKGAALYARQHFGAIYGQGEGRMGNSYGIATKDHSIQSRPLNQIQGSVDTFIEYAKANPNTQFKVTAVGCGLAGFNATQIAPMFQNCPDNCELPDSFILVLKGMNHER